MTTDHLPLASPNIVAQNIDKIAALFPNCVTETATGIAIDFDLLRQELSPTLVEGHKERYRLEWPGKRQAIVTANTHITNTLRPIRQDSVNFDTTQNLYIEGDNLEVLKLLQESYLAKIKMIYIDPPYNTGNDFVYKDNFAVDSQQWKNENEKDEYNQRLVANPDTAGRYHSDWLSMMYPRLKLARNLLTDDGVIFISIDDNEVHNLRKLCDEIFGEGNFVALFPWKKRTAKSDVPFGISQDFEWIVSYAKKYFNAGLTIERKYYQSDDFPNDKWRLSDLTTQRNAEERPNSAFEMVNPKNGRKYPYNQQRVWGVSKDTFQNYYNKGKIVFPDDYSFLNIKIPAFRVFESEDKAKAVIKYGSEEAIKTVTTILPKEVGMNEDGNKEMLNFFENKIFSFPKPVNLIKYIISIINDSDSLILDFFSGSATTAHAVMQLNAEDGGKRKFIMVQVPETTDPKSEAHKAGYHNICEIGKERIRRAGKKISLIQDLQDSGINKVKNKEQGKLFDENNSMNQESLTNQVNYGSDIGFRVYRLDSSNMQDVYYTAKEYNQEDLDRYQNHLKPDRSTEDLLVQIMLDLGLPLSLKIEEIKILGKSVYQLEGNALMVCFEDGIDEHFAKALANHKPQRVVFKDSVFVDDTAKVNVKQLLKQLSPETSMRVM